MCYYADIPPSTNHLMNWKTYCLKMLTCKTGGSHAYTVLFLNIV